MPRSCPVRCDPCWASGPGRTDPPSHTRTAPRRHDLEGVEPDNAFSGAHFIQGCGVWIRMHFLIIPNRLFFYMRIRILHFSLKCPCIIVRLFLNFSLLDPDMHSQCGMQIHADPDPTAMILSVNSLLYYWKTFLCLQDQLRPFSTNSWTS